MYLIFQSAITGRASLAPKDEDGQRAPETFSLMDMKPQTEEEAKRIRNTVVRFLVFIGTLLIWCTGGGRFHPEHLWSVAESAQAVADDLEAQVSHRLVCGTMLIFSFAAI